MKLRWMHFSVVVVSSGTRLLPCPGFNGTEKGASCYCRVSPVALLCLAVNFRSHTMRPFLVSCSTCKSSFVLAICQGRVVPPSAETRKASAFGVGMASRILDPEFKTQTRCGSWQLSARGLARAGRLQRGSSPCSWASPPSSVLMPPAGSLLALRSS